MPITQQQINSTMTFKKVKKDPTKGYRYVKKGGQGGKRAGAGLKPKFGSKLKNISVGVPEDMATNAAEIAELRKFFKECLTFFYIENKPVEKTLTDLKIKVD